MGLKKPTTSSVTTEQSINTLLNQSSEAQRDAPGGKIELLSGIANDLKLDQKKAPATDLSKQLKDLAEATKVSKKLNPKAESLKSRGYRGYKHAKSRSFGYKYSSRGQGSQTYKHLNSKRPTPPPPPPHTTRRTKGGGQTNRARKPLK